MRTFMESIEAEYQRYRSTAEAAIDRLDICYAPLAMPEVLSDAIELASTSSLGRKEVYLFTDLTQTAWSGASAEGWRKRTDLGPGSTGTGGWCVRI